MDHVSDINNQQLYSVAQKYNFPRFVLDAAVPSLYPEKLAAVNYADPATQQFPCHTAASTYLSAVYYYENQSKIPPRQQEKIAAAIWNAAHYFSIQEHLTEVEKVARQQYGDNLPTHDSEYAYVKVAADGTKVRKLPLRTSVQLVKSANHLLEFRDQLDYPERREIAAALLKRAHTLSHVFDASTHETLQRLAGNGYTEKSQVLQQLTARAALLPYHSPYREVINNIKTAWDKLPTAEITTDLLIKLAHTLDIFDGKSDLKRHYTTLGRPEDALFSLTFDKAAAALANAFELTTGSIYPCDALSKISRDDLAGLYGADFAADEYRGLYPDLTKIAANLAALPRPDAELFDELAAVKGIAPLYAKTKKAGYAAREWKNFASQR